MNTIPQYIPLRFLSRPDTKWIKYNQMISDIRKNRKRRRVGWIGWGCPGPSSHFGFLFETWPVDPRRSRCRQKLSRTWRKMSFRQPGWKPRCWAASLASWGLDYLDLFGILCYSLLTTFEKVISRAIYLWWTNIAMENGHRNSGFSHKKWWFSIANC